MPENSEQKNINPESNSSEQELNLEQQGQQLAAQIKDMHAKAETKEDYAEVQAKIAELRNMFEVKPEEIEQEKNGKVYHEFEDAIVPVYNSLEYFKNIPINDSDWSWYAIQTPSGIDMIDMGVIDIDDDGNDVFVDQSLFDENCPQEILDQLKDVTTANQGEGFRDLKTFIGDRKIRSYNEKGNWGIEIEPSQEWPLDEPRGKLSDVIANAAKFVTTVDQDFDISTFAWFVSQHEGELPVILIVTEIYINPTFGSEKYMIDEFHDSVEDAIENALYNKEGQGLEELKKLFNDDTKFVSLLGQDGNWYLRELNLE